MCGLAGFLIDETNESMVSGFTFARRKKLLKNMGEAIRHRGPDQEGEWLSDDGMCGLAHRRLAIVDLSKNGIQPMVSNSGRYVIAYNGEVYNHRDIASALIEAGVELKGSSDTEVIIESIALWGLSATLEKLHGMFAFALYDNETGELSIVRDRMGEKPLYVGSYYGQIVFSSELKSLHELFTYRLSDGEISKLPRRPELNRHAIGLYLRHGYVPAPYSIFENIFKLPAAHKVVITREQRAAFIKQPSQWLSAFTPYWSLDDVAKHECSSISQTAQQEQFQTLLGSVVQREMQADVPLGAFLSGGVDSSTIVALMQKTAEQQGGDAVRTFSIGFEQEEFNEAPFAAAVANHLGTQHYEQIVTVQDAQAVIPKLANIYDEPFADSSQIPTFLVSQLARSHVTVSLSGDGGDELFGGYERYDWAQRVWQKVDWLPLAARKLVGSLLMVLTELNHQKSPQKIQQLAAKFERLNAMLSAENRQKFYRILISSGVDADQLVLKDKDIVGLEDVLSKNQWDDEYFLHQMMYLDIHSYLPDDILTKVDRASMAISLESRVPLLDHAIVEQAWKMRDIALNRSMPAKQALRQVLYQSVPKELIERPKKGFAIPLAEWLRGDLKPWADKLLEPMRLQQEGVFDVEAVTKIWQNFIAGKAGAEHLLWSLLMFQLWQEQWY